MDLIIVFPLNPEIRGLIAREALINHETRGRAIKILKNLIGRIKVDPNWYVWYAIGMLNCSLADFPIGALTLEKPVKDQLLDLLDNNHSHPLEIVQELVRIELSEEAKKKINISLYLVMIHFNKQKIFGVFNQDWHKFMYTIKNTIRHIPY